MQIFLIIFFAGFAYLLFVHIKRFINNENSPMINEQAFVQRKITDASIDANGFAHTTLIIVFIVNGEEIKCSVSNRLYREIPEDVTGMLLHQGTRFQQFEYDGILVEK